MKKQISKTIDLKGLKCPLPVLRVKKQMKSISKGSLLEVFTDDPASIDDLKTYCQISGNNLTVIEENQMVYRFVVKKI
tara:strand:+ start:133 stop:366 length:234 start_codon:yes stop_codon:yes gene_type:complete